MSSFELEGFDEFEKALVDTIEKKYPNEAKKFMRTQIRKLRKDVVADTPRGETGNLKKGWKTSVRMRKGNIRAEIKNAAPHAHLIENGHNVYNQHGGKYGFAKGKHMLETNVEKKKQDFEGEVKKFLEEALKELSL